MTVFGKLLAFMNLLFSVIIGALIVFVFTTRANWQAAYEDAKKKAEAAEVAYKAEKAARENEVKQRTEDVKAVQAEVTRLQGEVTKAQEEKEQAQKSLADQTNLTKGATTASTAQQAELDQIKTERVALVKEKDDLRTRIVVIQKELDGQRQVAVSESLRAANLVQRNTNLLRQVEELTDRVRDLESSVTAPGGGGGGGASILEGAKPIAPGGVRGRVVRVGEQYPDLAEINVGSDSGLAVGNVLTVFLGGEYKGELKLTAVEPKTAVGRFTPRSVRREHKVAAGDSVITSFTGAGRPQ